MKTALIGLAAVSVLLFGCAPCHEEVAVEYPYHARLVSPGTQFAGLPPAVQHTIRAQAGFAEFYDIRKFSHSGRIVYEVLFANPDLNPPLYVETDGSVLYPDMTVAVGAGEDVIGVASGGQMGGLRLSDVPNDVVKSIHDQAPTAEIAYIGKVTVGDRVFYDVTFKDNSHPPLSVPEDGTVFVPSATVHLPVNATPPANVTPPVNAPQQHY